MKYSRQAGGNTGYQLGKVFVTLLWVFEKIADVFKRK